MPPRPANPARPINAGVDQSLVTEYARASAQWPFLHDLERQFHLPYGMLYALGTRESNLTNRGEIGGGAGHGVFQLDHGTWQIPPGFSHDVRLQATNAAAMLANAQSQGHTWV